MLRTTAIAEPTSADGLVPHLLAIAQRRAQDIERGLTPLRAAHSLNSSDTVYIYRADGGGLELPGVVAVDNPEIANLTLVVHHGDARGLATDIEERFAAGERVAVWDATGGDPALLEALLDSTVYLGNLAALDTDLEAVLALATTPIREGMAFRRTLAYRTLTEWVWRGSVYAELERRFGLRLSARDLPRAETQVRSRMGAWTTRLGRRGLRFQVGQMGFRDNHLDGFWFKLEAV
jgi:hypothetical protein